MGRRFIANDINPLMKVLAEPRTNPPPLEAVQRRLQEIDLTRSIPKEEDEPEVEVFFHRKTLAEIRALKSYLLQRRLQGTEDRVDQWIRMVATNRLTGHSKGFFSVYTLPPNQAVTPERQKKINEKYRNPTDEYRDVKNIILKKSKALLKEVPVPWPGVGGEFLNQDCSQYLSYSRESSSLNCDISTFFRSGTISSR
jgi:hypothetical protein